MTILQNFLWFKLRNGPLVFKFEAGQDAADERYVKLVDVFF